MLLKNEHFSKAASEWYAAFGKQQSEQEIFFSEDFICSSKAVEKN